MTLIRRAINILVMSALSALALTLCAFAWDEPGNSDLNILNGGVILSAEDGLYYSENSGIWLERDGQRERLTPEAGENLNLSGGVLYYTLADGSVRALENGAVRTVYSHGAEIKRLYVMGGTLRFISEGTAYSYDLSKGTLKRVSELADIRGLIPTEYGDIYLTGDVFDYTVWAGETDVLSGITSCYTDSGWLVVNRDGETRQVAVEQLFSCRDARPLLEPFTIHDGEDAVVPSDEDYGAEAEYLRRVQELGSVVTLMNVPSASGEYWSPELSEGQENIVKRARQLLEIQWTPLQDVSAWGGTGVFKAGTTYTGAPYGQPVNTGYIGYKVTPDEFLAAVNDNTSVFYTSYSYYNKIAPYYSCDCSGFVSYALGLKTRCNTSSLATVLTRVGDQSMYSLQVGDCLDLYYSHAALITDLRYDAEGRLIAIEVSEQTPIITQKTLFGAGGTRTLERFQSYYLNGGYVIYRSASRDNVTYTHSCAVPIDGDYCEHCAATAPWATVTNGTGCKTVTLSHRDANAVIYYTTDGSVPSADSAVYTGGITVYDSLTVKAVAVSASFTSGEILTCRVSVKQAGAPEIAVKSGLILGEYVSEGTVIALTSSAADAVIHYTTDGSAPTSDSQIYGSPITVSGDMTIRAFAVAPGHRASETTTLNIKLGRAFTLTASAGTGGSITPSGTSQVLESGTMTYSVKTKNGYRVGDVLVDGVSVGSVTSYTFSDIRADHSISVSFRMDVTLPFADVAETEWYYDAVCYAFANSLFNGVSDTEFSPATEMTRGMFITVLGRVAGVDGEMAGGTIGILTGDQVRIRGDASLTGEVLAVLNKYDAVLIREPVGEWYAVRYGGTEGFIRSDFLKIFSGELTDLAMEQYYSPHAQWAALTGILGSTVKEGIFNADMAMTREHMALVFYNYAKAYGVALPEVNARTVFTDDSAIGADCREAVYALQQAGIINGMGDGTFAPKSGATRAQVAQMYLKLLTA